ncbi:hypothetical protein [Thalassovita sp.]|uniref:hypothetical protein n=1 Tax=Thalassovita sp. TaxID=1979401 RepID=UPI002B267296|nr:hypothetical protein [Thalassovita sp.]
MRRSTLIFLACGFAFSILYLLFLEFQNRRAEEYLDTLRTSDPDGYLDQIRQIEGFSPFVREFSKLKNFENFNPTTPSFLIGRWTLRDKETRAGLGTLMKCTDAITFEHGRIGMARDGISLLAEFRLNGDWLEILPQDSALLKVHMISFGAAINHLELVPPGRDKLHYAYPCSQ